MIQSFACRATHDLFITRKSRRWSGCSSVALRKLDQVEAAVRLDDLRVPPGNRLEALAKIVLGSTAYGSMTNGASSLFGRVMERMMLRLGTTTEESWR